MRIPRVNDEARRTGVELRAHLDGQIGASVEVAMETGTKGRTQYFTQVVLDREFAAGIIVPAVVTRHNGQTLEAMTVEAPALEPEVPA